jgi:hypothetical protein
MIPSSSRLNRSRSRRGLERRARCKEGWTHPTDSGPARLRLTTDGERTDAVIVEGASEGDSVDISSCWLGGRGRVPDRRTRGGERNETASGRAILQVEVDGRLLEPERTARPSGVERQRGKAQGPSRSNVETYGDVERARVRGCVGWDPVEEGGWEGSTLTRSCD